jgi:kynurenine aminotransferase
MRHSLVILADEVYSRFSLTSPITHIASLFPEITLTVGSIGKDFAATGWRVGFVIGKSSLLAPVATAHRHTCYASPSAAQEAAATGYKEAETNGYWVQLRSSIQQKMEKLCMAWEGLGVPVCILAGFRGR